MTDSLIFDDKFTGLYDDNGQPIFVGNKLQSKWGYDVIVTKDKSGNNYHGKLVCNNDHPCKDIPYHLNHGKDHVIIP